MDADAHNGARFVDFWPFSAALAAGSVVAAVCGMQWICVIIEMLLANVARDQQRIVASSSSLLQLQLKPVFTFTRQHNFLLPVNCANFVSLRIFLIHFRRGISPASACYGHSGSLLAALHFVFGTQYSLFSTQYSVTQCVLCSAGPFVQPSTAISTLAHN